MLLLSGLVALPIVTAEPAAPGTVQPPGLDHFLCYDIVPNPLAEQNPFGFTPAAVELRDQFGRVQVGPQRADRLCNPVNKILPSGQGFPPQNVQAHLVCAVITPPNMPLRRVRVRNQFGEGRLTITPRERLCLPSWKEDINNPNAPGSVAVPRPAGTPVQPPGLDHFECYAAKFTTATAGGFPQKPPFVVLVDQFGTKQVTVGNPVELCNPVNKVLASGAQFPPQHPDAHLLCFQIQGPGDRLVDLQNQFGTARAVATTATRLCLPSFKTILRRPPPPDFNGNGTTDIAVFRPSSGFWFVNGGGTTAFGTSGDVPVAGDYDGDGDTDIAVFRPSTGTWFVMGGPTVAWGTSGDIPVPGDYDGDGDTDIAVFRPSTGTWFVMGGPTVAWGTSGDRPLPLPSAIRQFFFP